MSELHSTLLVERLAEAHDRLAFVSGIEVLDRYLQVLASQDAKRKIAAPFVLVEPSGAVIGYYTLSAHTVLLTEIPETLRKSFPKYPLVPVTLLGRLAVSRQHQGQKLGRFLLMDALRRSCKNSAEVASAAVVVDAINDEARAFYKHHEFAPLAGHANKLLLSMKTIEKLFVS